MTEQLKVRHLGCRWAAPEEAQADNRVLRALFRLGSKTGLGKLANYAGFKLKDPRFEASLAKLAEWKMVELASANWGESVRASLTPEGTGFAEELCHKAQVEEQDASRQEVSDANKARLRAEGWKSE